MSCVCVQKYLLFQLCVRNVCEVCVLAAADVCARAHGANLPTSLDAARAALASASRL